MKRFFARKNFLRRENIEIEPDEIFMDSVNIPGFHAEMQEGRMERPIARRSFLLFASLLAAGFLVLVGRLIQLEILRGEAFLAQAQANKTYPLLVQAPRGIFSDRYFEKLVENVPTFVVSLKPSAMASDEEFRGVLVGLAAFFGKNVSDIAEANGLAEAGRAPAEWQARTAWPAEVFLAAGELREEILELQTRRDDFPGLAIAEADRRNYLLGPYASHVLGYVGRPSREDLLDHPDVRPSEVIGKAGLEFQYEEALRGRAGEKLIEVNASGEAQRERFIVKAVAGKNVVLEIDAGLQRFAAATLERHLRALGKRAGAIVALDPRDGAVRALVSFPTYDSNTFGRTTSPSAFGRLLRDPGNPFFNRAIAGGYPAGSTIKPILAVAALEESIIDPERSIYDPGYISVPNPYDPAHPTIFKDWKELGFVDMRRAIALSANVYFYTIGGGYRDIKGLGIERIKKFLERFGWGRPLGIDLPGEAAGLIPDPEKKKTIRPKDPIWRIGDTYITAIGQGDLQATPLQLAVSTAALANGGTLWTPRLAQAVVDEERRVLQSFFPQAIAANLAHPENLAIVREGMRQAVTGGSAASLQDLFFSTAGKTGTAQTGVYGKNHGWFVGFAPYENPELVITVLVEEGTGGSTDAVPIAKEVLYYYFTSAHNSQLTTHP